MAGLQYSCLGNPHGQRSLVVYCPWSHKESDMTERLTPERSSLLAQWESVNLRWSPSSAANCEISGEPVSSSVKMVSGGSLIHEK